MKRSVIISLILLIICRISLRAQFIQEVYVDGEKLDKRIVEIVIDGDNVNMQYADSEWLLVDMSKVYITLSSSSDSDVRESNIMTYAEEGNRMVLKQRNEDMLIYNASSIKYVKIDESNNVTLGLGGNIEEYFNNSLNAISFTKYTDTYQSNFRTYKDPTVTYTLTDETKILSNYMLDHIVEITDDHSLVFDSSSDPDLLPNVGELFVYTLKNRILPDGYIGRIKSVRQESGQYIVEMDDVTLDVVFKDLDYNNDFDMTNFTGIYDGEGNEIPYTSEIIEVNPSQFYENGSGEVAGTRGFNISKEISVKIKVDIKTLIPNSKKDSIILSGELSLGGEFNLHVDNKGMALLVSPFIMLKGSIGVETTKGLSYEKSHFRVLTIPLAVSASNVIARPELEVNAFFTLEGQVKLMAELTFQSKKEYSIKYSKGEGWSVEQKDALTQKESPFKFKNIEGSLELAGGFRVYPSVKILLTKTIDLEETYMYVKFGYKGEASIGLFDLGKKYNLLSDIEVKRFISYGVYAKFQKNIFSPNDTISVDGSNEIDLGRYYLVPEFSHFSSSPMSHGFQEVRTRVSRDLLANVDLKYRLYHKESQTVVDGGELEIGRYKREEGYANPVRGFFSGLTPGDEYELCPLVTLFGIEMEANRFDFEAGATVDDIDPETGEAIVVTPEDFAAGDVCSSSGGFEFDELDSHTRTCAIKFASGGSGVVKVPKIYAQVGGNGTTYYTIVKIKDKAFRQYGASSVIIPSTIREIGEEAFYGSSIVNITIPKSVKTMGKGLFFGCTQLTSVVFENTFDDLPNSTFYNCSKLTDVTLPSGIRSLGNLSFYGCSSLSAETLPSSIESVGTYVFSGCTQMTDLPSFVNHMSEIPEGAFSNTGFVKLTLPESVESLGEECFSNCLSLEEIYLPQSIRKMNTPFSGNINLKTVTIDCVNNIGSWSSVFGNSSSDIVSKLTVEIGPRTTIIKDDFLSSIEPHVLKIPKNVIKVGNRPRWHGIGSLYLERLDISAEWNKLVNSARSVYIGDAVISIPDNFAIFKGYGLGYFKNLTNVSLGNSVKTIGKNAFSNTNLNAVSFGKSIKTIGENAFSSTQLENIVIPNTVTEIASGAFAGCGELTTVTLPSNLKKISSRMFMTCSNLVSISLPSSLESIGDSAFWYTGITSIEIPNSVTTLGTCSFLGCKNLTSITLPTSITTIPPHCVQYCPMLKELNIPASVETIKDWAFANNSAIKDIIIPNKVSYIGNYAFGGCSSASSVTIPNSVTFLGDSVFYGCSSLEMVDLPYKLSYIGKKAFYQNVDLSVRVHTTKPVMIPGEVFGNTRSWYNSETSQFEREFSTAATLYIPVGSIDKYEAAGWPSQFLIVEETSGIITGDSNTDDRVDVADIVEVINAQNNHPSANYNTNNADLNSDGVVNTDDIKGIDDIIMEE